MKRADMVRTGAAQLMLAEEALERALVETSSLGVLLGQLRLQSGISMVVGQDAFDEIASTITGLTAARRSMVRAHERLDQVKTKIGCRTVAGGALDKPPDALAKLEVVNAA